MSADTVGRLSVGRLTLGTMARRGAVVRALPFAVVAFALSACSWFTDFKDQPKLHSWETPADTIGMRGNPQMSVPITGSQVPGYAVSYQKLGATLDSMSGLRNPVPSDARSLDNGRKYYQINCEVCHGMAGGALPTAPGGGALGDGPVAGPKYGLYPPSLRSGTAKSMSDGSLWGIIRNGRGAMPTYNRIEDLDRWDVVNYIRELQKDVVTVPTTPAGKPGETGRAVPGFTRTGPTRPAPYWRPNVPATTDSAATGADSAARPETNQ